MISANGHGAHTCALRANGTVACWGANSNGQLGDGTTTERHTPVNVTGLTDAVAISVNVNFSCAVRANGTVRCWGQNASGTLGDNTTTDRHAPVQVVGLGNATAIATGFFHACALLADGTVRCWGDNSSGQLGDGTTTERHTPVQVVGLTNVIEIGAGAAFTCALRSDGTVQCWGTNMDSGQNFGKLGVGNNITSSTVPLPLGLVNVTSLSVGPFHSCAGETGGALFCWGLNNNGQLGDGSTGNIRFTPVLNAGIVGTISATALTATSLHSCAIRSNGSSACWGANTIGQLGDGTSGNIRTSPVVVNGLGSPATISAGDQHTCGVRAPGNAMCWGSNLSGQLGDNTLTSRASPVFVSGIANAREIVGGGNHSCALLGNGTVQCWGSNTSGQLGDGTLTSHRLPAPVSSLSNVVALTAGTLHTCALIGDGTVRCWGKNGSGQLGDGTNTDHSTPIQVSGISNATAIAAGNAHTCVVLSDGTARCWGAGTGGQLGNGGTTNSTVALQVSTLTNAVTIVAGDLHSCALRSDGTMRCWGKNNSGQLGTGNTVDQVIPAQVTGLTNISAIAAGIHGIHTCALRVNGAPQCWGANNAGQIGDGTTTNRPSATQVPSFTFNIDPDVVASANGRIAHVTALANCPDGAFAQIRVELTQGLVSGVGQTIGECTGGLSRYPVVVPAFGRDSFLSGPGQADADAVVKDRGQIIEVEEWTRDVTVSSE